MKTCGSLIILINHVVIKPLSDEIHYGGDSEHNPEFDHEAFLGEEEARHFDELSPEESKFRLGFESLQQMI